MGGGSELNMWKSTVSSPEEASVYISEGIILHRDTSTQGLSGELLQLVCPSQGLTPFPGLFHEKFVL